MLGLEGVASHPVLDSVRQFSWAPLGTGIVAQVVLAASGSDGLRWENFEQGTTWNDEERSIAHSDGRSGTKTSGFSS